MSKEAQGAEESAEKKADLAGQLEKLNIQSEDDLIDAIVLFEIAKDDPTFDQGILTKALEDADAWVKANFHQDVKQIPTFNFYYSKISLIQLALKKEQLVESTRSNLPLDQ